MAVVLPAEWLARKGDMTQRGAVVKGVLNYIGLQVGWFACALGAARGYPWVGPLVVAVYVVLHLSASPSRRREAMFILTAAVLGLVVDSLKKIGGLLTYASPIPDVWWLAPLWIVAMWALFSTTLNGALAWLQGRYLVAIVLGAVFGPLSYLAGEGIGAIQFNYGLPLTLGILAVVWAGVVPLLAWLARRMVTASLVGGRAVDEEGAQQDEDQAEE